MGSASAKALTQARGRSVIVVMGNTPETCASVRESGSLQAGLPCMAASCPSIHLSVCSLLAALWKNATPRCVVSKVVPSSSEDWVSSPTSARTPEPQHTEQHPMHSTHSTQVCRCVWRYLFTAMSGVQCTARDPPTCRRDPPTCRWLFVCVCATSPVH